MQRKGGHVWPENIRRMRETDTRWDTSVKVREEEQLNETNFVCTIHNEQDTVVHAFNPDK